MNKIERRKQREAELSPETLSEYFSYDRDSGIIRWRVDKGRAEAGSEAGSVMQTGYRNLEIFGRKYQAHRVAWALMTGRWPEFDLDHADADKLNNRWGNLREASRSQNCANRKVSRDASSGVKGVWFHKKNRKWIASAGKKYLGSFNTIDEAQAAYWRAASELHGEFARPS